MTKEPCPQMIYTIRCTPYDGGGEKDTVLSNAFREFFSNGKTVRGNVRSVESGLITRTRYRIGKGVFCWSKIGGRCMLEEVFRKNDGNYHLLVHNPAEELVSDSVYDFSLRWLQTAYFTDETSRPAAALRPSPNGIWLLLAARDGKYRRRELLPLSYRAGTALQSFSNSKAGGEPQVIAQTDAGEFCYCSAKERSARLAALQSAAENEDGLKPEWPDDPDEPLDFHFIPNDYPSPAAYSYTVPPEALAAPDYAANREIFSIEVLPPKPSPVPIPDPSPAPCPQPVPSPGHPSPAPLKYAVAAKGLSGGVVHAGLKRNAVPKHEPVEDELIPAKRIVVSSSESYLYFGDILDGLRNGRGRTQMPGGRTAYEGEYRNDKRDGYGAFYYKSGRLCYAGGWKQNLRDGMGVAFGSKDGSVFVGNWKNNIPTGTGSAFDLKGNLIYTGEWQNGKRHGKGTEYENGCVRRTGEWRDDRFCSGYEYRKGRPYPLR